MQQIFQPQNRATPGRTGFSRDMTDADLSTHLRSVSATGGLLVNFFHTKVRIKSRDAAQNGEIQTRLCVSKQPKGDRSTVAVRFITEEQAERQFPHEYGLFKQYAEVPTQGTPLDELPGISMSQIGLLVLNGLRSIEDLLDISEDQIAQLGLDAIKAQKTAKAWAAKRAGNAETINAADIEARLMLQLETIQKSNEAMAERNRQLEAQVAALQAAGGGGGGNTPSVTEPQEIGGEPDLEYDLSKMPDPFSEGPATSDGGDDIADSDFDPLEGAI